MFFDRLPTWGWFLVFLLFTFIIFNPTGFSLVTLFQEHGFFNPFVWMLGFVLFLVPGLALIQGVKELNWFGKVLFVALVVLCLWCVAYFTSWNTIMETAAWWIYLPIAAFLTLSIQFAKWRRRITGTSSVDDADEAPST